MKTKNYYELTKSWLQNPANTAIVGGLQEKFNDETVENFILFFFEPLLRRARENGSNNCGFERPLKNIIELVKIAGLYDAFREILQEINASCMLSALTRSTYNEHKGKSKFTYERFLTYIDVI